MRGWTPAGNAFQSQPTYGDNSRARVNRPANHQGDFWIGTFERHPRGGTSPGSAQGDGPQGTLTSQAFEIPGGNLTFLIGGGSSFETRVELMIADPIEGSIRAHYASGRNSETMQRVTWDLSRFSGQQGFLRIVDESSAPWGHINVDDFRFSADNTLVADLPIDRLAVADVGPTRAVVPDLIGGSADSARRALDDAGLRVGGVGRMESTEPEGSVVSQGIEAGTRVEQGTAVDIAVAVPVMRTVPDVVGRPEPDARRQLEAAGLQPGDVSSEESRGETGVVLRQSVAPGSSVVLGSVVDLVVSTPMTAVVPELVGLSEAEARRQVEAVELAVGDVVETESRRERGIVVTQSERAGSRVVLGTPIDMLVAVPVTVEVPDLGGRSVSEARGLLEGLELALGNVTSEESREPEGSVLAQQPGAGARTEINTAVDVVIAEPVTVLVPELVGFAEEDARRLLQEAELTVAGISGQESREPVGTVLGQGVAAGERVVIGTPVSLVLAELVTVLVPEVVGSAEADAAAALEAAELVVGDLSYQESPATVGTVLTQSLNPGTRVQIGTPVNLLVAVVETVAVPELIGMPVEEARRALVTGRLEVGTEELRETRVESEGTVLEQSRAAGTAAAVGTPVSLIVATPEIVTVPSLVGLSEEEAVAAITGAGLVVGVVGESLSTQAGGTVLQQRQPAGSQVVFSTPVGLQVARDRTIWVVPGALALLLFVAAATVAARKRVRGRRAVRRMPQPPDEKPPVPEIHARPIADPGRQVIDGDPDEGVSEGEIRLRPIIGPGTGESESPDDLISGEERPDDPTGGAVQSDDLAGGGVESDDLTRGEEGADDLTGGDGKSDDSARRGAESDDVADGEAHSDDRTGKGAKSDDPTRGEGKSGGATRGEDGWDDLLGRDEKSGDSTDGEWNLDDLIGGEETDDDK